MMWVGFEPKHRLPNLPNRRNVNWVSFWLKIQLAFWVSVLMLSFILLNEGDKSMTALVTVLTEFSTNGDSKTSTTAGHLTSKPKLVVEKRRVPVGNQTVSEYVASVIQGAIDPDGNALPSKVVMSATVRIPLNIKAGETTVADVLAIFRDVVQSTEFGNSVTTQNWLK